MDDNINTDNINLLDAIFDDDDDINFDNINFDEVSDDISDDVNDYFKFIQNNRELNANPFFDKFSTYEQKQRDKCVSTLLKNYVSNYENKIKKNMAYKSALFYVFLTLTALSTLIFLGCICYLSNNLKNLDTIDYLLKILPISITFISLIIGTLKIIVKYVFPEREEEYITKIVEIIQNNDLEHKKENIRCNQSNTNTRKSEDETINDWGSG